MTDPRFSLIAAMATNRVIGVRNALPWRLPDDLSRFKALTLGCPVVMGRKTLESLPGGKPLPGRRNIVVTRNTQYSAPDGCDVVHSLDEAVTTCANAEEVFFIGGAELYRAALPLAERVYLTEVHAEVDGDVQFPALSPLAWFEHSRTTHPADAQHAHAFDFVIYDHRAP